MAMSDYPTMEECSEFLQILAQHVNEFTQTLAIDISEAGYWEADLLEALRAVLQDFADQNVDRFMSFKDWISDQLSSLDLDYGALEAQFHNFMDELETEVREFFIALNLSLLDSPLYKPVEQVSSCNPFIGLATKHRAPNYNELSKTFLRLRLVEENTRISLNELKASIGDFSCFLRSRVRYDDALAKEILGFFNEVNASNEIQVRIKDDPNFGSPLKYGITLSTANRILETRENLLGRRFTSIKQIDEVKGVGPSTLHNILYSYSER